MGADGTLRRRPATDTLKGHTVTTKNATAIPEPPEGTFVCWCDPNVDPFAVYYRTDQHDTEAEADHWYSACQDADEEVRTWQWLLDEMSGWRGPVELVSNGELARTGGAE